MGQDDEEGHFVEHVSGSHMILFSCKNIGEDQMNQGVRILVHESKIPKNDEEYKVFLDVAKKGITEM